MYVRVSPRLRGRLAGLCGNFDGDAENDFGSRDGALEATPEIFGDSWRLSPLCPEADGHRPHPCDVREQGDLGDLGGHGETWGTDRDTRGLDGDTGGHGETQGDAESWQEDTGGYQRMWGLHGGTREAVGARLGTHGS